MFFFWYKNSISLSKLANSFRKTNSFLIHNNLENITGKDSQENNAIGSEEKRSPLAKVQKRASLSETVPNTVKTIFQKFM